MSPKEQFIADRKKCPNCGNDKFMETHVNAAEGFRCDCGLEFNFMSVLGIVDITRDPQPDLPKRLWATKTIKVIPELAAKLDLPAEVEAQVLRDKLLQHMDGLDAERAKIWQELNDAIAQAQERGTKLVEEAERVSRKAHRAFIVAVVWGIIVILFAALNTWFAFHRHEKKPDPSRSSEVDHRSPEASDRR